MNNCVAMRCFGCREVLPRAAFETEGRVSQRCARCRAEGAKFSGGRTDLRAEHFDGSNVEPVQRRSVARDLAWFFANNGVGHARDW